MYTLSCRRTSENATKREKLHQSEVNNINNGLYFKRLMGRVPIGPIGRASCARDAVNPGVDVHLEIGSTHCPFAVDPRHCFHLVHRMLKTHQPSFTVEHATCIIPMLITIMYIIQVQIQSQLTCNLGILQNIVLPFNYPWFYSCVVSETLSGPSLD